MVYEAAVIMSFSIASFLFMHFGIQLGKSENQLYKAMQTLFIMFGLYLILLTVTIGRTIAANDSASASTLDTIDTGVTILTWTVYVFFAIFFIALIYSVITWIHPKKKAKVPTV